MPVYVNRIFNNTTESEKKKRSHHFQKKKKNANTEDESQQAFTKMGNKYPEMLILCHWAWIPNECKKLAVTTFPYEKQK